MKKLLLFLAMMIPVQMMLLAQPNTGFTQNEIDKIRNKGSGISGPGKPVTGNGWGGWRSGSNGIMYAGKNPQSDWTKMDTGMITASVIKNGLLPPVKPIWDVHIRDAVVILGGDGNYYLTGSTGDNIWAHADGVELWKSKDLQKWEYMGLVWSIEKDGNWEKAWADLHGKPARALWAPELHYVKGNYFIVLSMPPGGISILRSTSGKPEGPYVHAYADPSKPFIGGIDPTLFQDDDGKVYFTWSGAGRIALMKDDMSGFETAPQDVQLLNPDHDLTHHSAKCGPRGTNDLGHEGAVLFKANGKYYRGAADEYEGRYSTCLSVSDSIFGPYTMRHESVPCGGGTNFFKDKKGNWWSAFFGNDSQSPWREKPGIVKVEFDREGKVIVAPKQPDFILVNNK